MFPSSVAAGSCAPDMHGRDVTTKSRAGQYQSTYQSTILCHYNEFFGM